MSITQINNNPKTLTVASPSFKSARLLTSAFMAMDKHEIIGVSTVDLSSMVIPRSAIDFTRNKEAGIETMIREGSSTATHASIGLAGLTAAALLAQGLKKKNYNVDFKRITADNNTISAMADVFKQIVDESPKTATKEELARKFLSKIFENVKGLAGNSDNADKKLWYSLSSTDKVIDQETINTKKQIVDILLKQQKTNNSYMLSPNILSKLEAYMNIDIPSTQVLQVKLANKVIDTKGSHFLADAHALTKAFTQDKVLESFRASKDAISSEFIKDLEKLCTRKTFLGLAAICAVALSMQTINRHLTKRRTGIDGFVGDPDYQKTLNDKNANHKKKNNAMLLPLKMLSILGMGFFIYKTLNSRFCDLAKNIQFKGFLPTINQIKVVYGSTILGRLFAASDTNELRESTFRDFLGYTNFLVLGPLITKCFINSKDKSLINYDSKVNGKGLLNWLKNSSIKTYQEIINSTLKNSVITEKGTLALKDLYNNNYIQEGSTIANKLSILNKAKLIGILYSCIALGVIVPLINKTMTEASKRKRKSNETQNISELQQLNQIKNSDKTNKTQKIINDFLSRTNIHA